MNNWEMLTGVALVWCGTILITSCIFQKLLERAKLRNENGNRNL